MISAGEYNRSWLFNVNTLEKSLKSKLIFEYLNNLVKEVNCESSDSVENNLKKWPMFITCWLNWLSHQ